MTISLTRQQITSEITAAFTSGSGSVGAFTVQNPSNFGNAGIRLGADGVGTRYQQLLLSASDFGAFSPGINPLIAGKWRWGYLWQDLGDQLYDSDYSMLQTSTGTFTQPVAVGDRFILEARATYRDLTKRARISVTNRSTTSGANLIRGLTLTNTMRIRDQGWLHVKSTVRPSGYRQYQVLNCGRLASVTAVDENSPLQTFQQVVFGIPNVDSFNRALIWFGVASVANGYSNKGYISISTSGAQLVSLSDHRLKTNIRALTDCREAIDRLRPRTYIMDPLSGHRYHGFIAHELQEIMPKAVIGQKDEVDADGKPVYQSLIVKNILPWIVGASRELAREISDLRDMIQQRK